MDYREGDRCAAVHGWVLSSLAVWGRLAQAHQLCHLLTHQNRPPIHPPCLSPPAAEIISRLQSFTHQNRVKCLLMTVAAHHLSDDEIGGLRKVRRAGAIGTAGWGGSKGASWLPTVHAAAAGVGQGVRCSRKAGGTRTPAPNPNPTKP